MRQHRSKRRHSSHRPKKHRPSSAHSKKYRRRSSPRSYRRPLKKRSARKIRSRPRKVSRKIKKVVRPKYWIPLAEFERELHRRWSYKIRRSDPFLPWLKFAYIGKRFEGLRPDEVTFLWKTTKGPGEETSFMTVSVWYIVERDYSQDGDKENEFYLWVWRTRVQLPDLTDTVAITLPYAIDRIQEHVKKTDYLYLRSIVAFTGTPDDDWAMREDAGRRRFQMFERDKAQARRRGKRLLFKQWKRRHPLEGFIRGLKNLGL